jgi:Glycine zipper 2TM domain
MRTTLSKAAMMLASPALIMIALPAGASAPFQHQGGFSVQASADHGDTWNHGRRHRGWDRGDDDRRYGYQDERRSYDEPVYRDTQTWRGEDGRSYCRRRDGTTGLIIGGAAGALLGREVAGRGDRTLGAILGAAGGALLGRSVDRNSARCR